LEFDKYLRAQGELGGFEIVLNEPIRRTDSPKPIEPIITKPVIAKPVVTKPQNQNNDSLWQNATDIKDFYSALQQHSIYTKSMRPLSFYVPKEINANAQFFLIFHSPQEITAAAKNVLDRLFNKLNIDLNACAISFFFKCNEAAMPREKPVLKDMLYKEIEFINPEKIIFFRETNSNINIDGSPITLSGKPAITLYSLLEMAGSNDKIKGTWTALQQSAWFSPNIFQAQK